MQRLQSEGGVILNGTCSFLHDKKKKNSTKGVKSIEKLDFHISIFKIHHQIPLES